MTGNSHDNDRPLAWHEGSVITRSQVMGAANALAARLPDRPYVLNLATDRLQFLVGLLASFMRGQLALLPSSRAPDALSELVCQYPDCYCMVPQAADGPEGVEACAFDLVFNESRGWWPTLDRDRAVAIVFTSGSTGVARPAIKTWGALSSAALAINARLGIGKDAPQIVATVPHQHMYGLETSIFLAVMGGSSFHSARPLFPEDVRVTLESLPGPRLLVTTPVHIRALLASDVNFPVLCGVLSATAPLSQETARFAEERFGCALWEIYGFSEAGSVATRRTAHEAMWRILDGLSIQETDHALQVIADYLPSPVPFPDRVALHDANRLELLGRGSDIVNIGGHRASLQALNQKLLDIPEVDDGIFVPPAGDCTMGNRMVAYVVAPRSNRESIMSALRRCIDPVFLPRPLYFVPSLLRNATGKITQESLTELASRHADGKERDHS